MKRGKLVVNQNGGKGLSTESRAKIYVPISIKSKNGDVVEQNEHGSWEEAMRELKKANSELKQKQEIYIDKLIKLEEGLEKQHLEFKQLQDLYNQLLNSYKHKQQEISELQQKYRESNRKKQTPNHFNPPPKQPDLDFKKQIDDQKQVVEKLQTQLARYKLTVHDLNKTVERLYSENSYYKNKDRMNDSRVSLNSKVFEELGEWQRQLDIEKEQKIKLDYENKFLTSRNSDLENRVVQLEQLLLQKQAEVVKLRQNNIVLTRENSENRFLRSSSRSPRKSDEKDNSDRKSEKSMKKIRVMDQLYQENKSLRKQLETQRSKQVQGSRFKNEQFIKQQQFYSFSQDDHSNHSSNQETHQPKCVNKGLFIKVENNFEVLQKAQFLEEPQLVEELNRSDESLQQLPAQLEIDNLISRNKKKDLTQAP